MSGNNFEDNKTIFLSRMAEDLNSLLQMYNLTKRNQDNIHIKGQIIEILKNLSYFRTQMNLYGADILEYYIPLLEVYNIREHSEFFDDS